MSNSAPVSGPQGRAEERPQPLPLTPNEAEALRNAVERIIRAGGCSEEGSGPPEGLPRP